jgi:RNA polymerase sigma-70 factor (ECF subfamily)
MDVTAFEEHRPLLFAIAYRMLGTVAEAEDVVQDAYLRWRTAAGVRDPRAYLATAVTRLSVDRLRSAQRRRETYVGPWLPEPLLGAAPDAWESVELRESLSLAFLTLLEALAPPERAALLLREVFAYPYDEIAGMLARTEASVRQLVHRAKRRLGSGARRAVPSEEEHREVLRLFLRACSEGDVAGLATMLAEDAVAYTDGGGETPAARRPVRGAARVARFLVNLTRKVTDGTTVDVVRVNGAPGIVLRDRDALATVLALDVRAGAVAGVYVVAAPSKLARASVGVGEVLA